MIILTANNNYLLRIRIVYRITTATDNHGAILFTCGQRHVRVRIYGLRQGHHHRRYSESAKKSGQ